MKIDKERLLNDLAYVFGDKDYFDCIKQVVENQPECDSNNENVIDKYVKAFNGSWNLND